MLKFLGWALSIFMIAAHLAGQKDLAHALTMAALVCFQSADIRWFKAPNAKVSGPEAALSPEGRARLPGCAPAHNGE